MPLFQNISRIMKGFLAFLGAFRLAGWPPPATYICGMIALGVWGAFPLAFPESNGVTRGSWAILAFFTAQFWSRAPAVVRASGRRAGAVYFGTMCCWIPLAAIAVFSIEKIWLQHYLTIVQVVLALSCLAELCWRTPVASWDWGVDRHGHHPQFVCGLLLFHLMVALLNEAFVQALSFDGWLVWLALSAPFSWLVSRALMITLAASLSEESD